MNGPDFVPVHFNEETLFGAEASAALSWLETQNDALALQWLQGRFGGTIE